MFEKIKIPLSKNLNVLRLATKKLAVSLFTGGHKQIIVFLLFACAILSVVIPPFQSPDEHAHIQRAYLLGKGVLVLDRPEGKSSGGYIDNNLLKFMESYGVVKGKLSAEEIRLASETKWSGNRVYSPFPGAGYYFPAAYLPQTLGLWVGELLNFTIDHSYRLSRAFALAAIALLFYFAFRLYPPNPLALALTAIPMSLFQFSSASLDGVSTALAFFSISAFLHIATNRGSSSVLVQFAFALTVAVLASCRIHALPLLILLAATFLYTKRRSSLFLFAAVALFVFAWTFLALKTTTDLKDSIGDSTFNIVVFYLFNPAQFFVVVWQTLSNQNLQEFYWKSFIGILGWLDSPFHSWYYYYFASILSAVALLTVSFKDIMYEWSQRLLLFATSVISVLLIFFSLLVTWSQHPAQIIEGVQGRYFLIPSIAFAYCVAGNVGLNNGFRRTLATFIVFILFVFSVMATVDLLLNRYYLVENKVETEIIVFERSVLDGSSKMVLSAPLNLSSPISLKFPLFGENGLGKVTRIGIMFGTYVRRNPGEAELILTTKSGSVYSQKFSLPDLVDNAYHYFRVPADYYTSGELKVVSGGGVSVWEVPLGDNRFLSCLKLDTIRNQKAVIYGCP